MKQNITLGPVQETLLLPLWGRALESQKPQPLLRDTTAVEIIEKSGYDFSTIKKNISTVSCASWIARSIWFDEKIKVFLEEHPDGTIINAGCGLDTTYDRVDNGKAMWYEIDHEDVIVLRKQYIKEDKRRKFIPASLTDGNWQKRIVNKENVLIILAGVIYYFDDAQVKQFLQNLVTDFGRCSLVFDYCSKIGLRMANKQVLKAGGMNADAFLKFSSNDIHEVGSRVEGVQVVEDFPLFRDHRRKYPPLQRIGMMLSDSLKIMSLARLEIDSGNTRTTAKPANAKVAAKTAKAKTITKAAKSAGGKGKPAPSKAAAKSARTSAGTKTKAVSKKAGSVPAKKKTAAKGKTAK